MTGRSGIIFELISMGRYIKVSAICTKTGKEVSIVGDPSAGQAELKRIAKKKLLYVMEKESETSKKGGLYI